MRLRLLFALSLAGCGNGDQHMMLGNLDLGAIDATLGGGFDLAPYDLPRISADLPMDPGGPDITIVMPMDGARVSGPTLTVTAKVVPKPGQTVTTVTMFGPAPSPNAMPPTAQMSRTMAADTFQGTLDMSAFPTGPLDVVVQAEDLAMHQSSKKVTYQRDAGPDIVVYSPKAQTYRGSAAVLFSVLDAAGVDEMATTALVQQVPIQLMEIQQNPPTYSGLIDFHSQAFKVALSGQQALHITAKNKNGTVSEIDAPFTVDEVGPTITFLNPLPGGFVGGYITIEAQIDDISNVADATVQAIIPDVDANGKDFTHAVPLVREGSMMMSTDKFKGMFDTRTLNQGFVFSDFAVQAADTLGNVASLSEEVTIDNVPPSIDMDPPKTRVRKILLGRQYECSQQFDPLGDETANDGDIQNQVVWLKARVEDRGNTAYGLAIDYPSTVVQDSIELWAIAATDAPLVVDTNGDSVCDDVNPELKPAQAVMMPKQALAIALAHEQPGGAPDYSMDNLTPPPACVQDGDGGALPPPPLCVPTTLTYALGYTIAAIPSIYTVPPVAQNQAQCQGLQIDLLNKLPDGPVCLTVRAQDVAGNHNVSAPLRLCIDKFKKGICDQNIYRPHGSNNPLGALPDCSGTVDAMGNVSKTPCQSGVKLNTGKVVPPFPSPGEPYIAM